MCTVLEPKPSIAEHQTMNRTLLAVLVLGLGLGGCSLVLDDPLAFQGQIEADMADAEILPDRHIRDRYVPRIEVDARLRPDRVMLEPDMAAEPLDAEPLDAERDPVLDLALPDIDMSVVPDMPMTPDVQMPLAPDMQEPLQDMEVDQSQSANDGDAMAGGG